MTVAIIQQLPELRISFNADVGDTAISASDDYVWVVDENGTNGYWQVEPSGHLAAYDVSGTFTPLLVGPSGVAVVTAGGGNAFLLVNTVQNAVGGAPVGPVIPPWVATPVGGGGVIDGGGGLGGA